MTTQPEITKKEVDTAVKALARLDRAAAVEILSRFDALNTPQLKPEAWRPVFEACEEARAKIAGVQ